MLRTYNTFAHAHSHAWRTRVRKSHNSTSLKHNKHLSHNSSYWSPWKAIITHKHKNFDVGIWHLVSYTDIEYHNVIITHFISFIVILTFKLFWFLWYSFHFSSVRMSLARALHSLFFYRFIAAAFCFTSSSGRNRLVWCLIFYYITSQTVAVWAPSKIYRHFSYIKFFSPVETQITQYRHSEQSSMQFSDPDSEICFAIIETCGIYTSGK